jgi:hypothetical protein
MKFMVMVRATAVSESGAMPSEKLLGAMGKFNEELVKAGVLLAGEGLHPSARGARIRFEGDRRSVIDGPFADTRELIAGFWILETGSKEEVVEWMKRCPNPFEDGVSEVEIRQLFTADDFGAEFTPDMRAAEQTQRAQLAARQGS